MSKIAIKSVEGLIVAGGFVGSFVLPSVAYQRMTHFNKNIVIRNKYQRLKDDTNNSSCILMVSDSENNQYRISDSLWNGLEENKKYNVDGYGWKFGFLSMYPNIYAAKEYQSVEADRYMRLSTYYNFNKGILFLDKRKTITK